MIIVRGADTYDLTENRIRNEAELTRLLVHAMKELGEIAEVLVRKNRPDHWRCELGDLCGLCIRPMLSLAGMSFDEACEVGFRRRDEKSRKDTQQNTDKNQADEMRP